MDMNTSVKFYLQMSFTRDCAALSTDRNTGGFGGAEEARAGESAR